jgi:hypothetical protein
LNGNSGAVASTNLSGDVEYLSTSTVHPTTLLYGGGVLFSSQAGQRTSTFQSATASQGLVGGGWAVGVSDSLSYLPQSPTTGLVGIPGVGDIGLQPVPDPTLPAQSILTNYGKRLSNSVSGNVERKLGGRNSVSGSASYGILRFVGSNATGTTNLDSNQLSGEVGVNRRLNPRSSVSLSGQYATFSYEANPTSFTTRGLSLQFTRQLSRTLSLQASAGPQWVNGFGAVNPSSSAITQIPSRLSLQAGTSLLLTRKSSSVSLAYSRGVTNGSGVQLGSTADNVSLSAQRTYGRDWSASATGAFAHNSGLVDNYGTSTFYAGTQVSRRLLRPLSGFVSYTGIHQSINTALMAQNAFSGFSQVFAIGITFAPRQTRLGQF